MARFFKSGTLHQEVVATYDSGDLVVLVTIEKDRAMVGELPEQDGLYASRKSFVMRAPNGSSYTGTPIR